MKRFPLMLLGLVALGCELGPFPKEPETPQPPEPMGWGETTFAAGGGSSCPKAIENTKRLACGFEAADPAAWCATLTAAQVKCLSGAKNCLANSRCTEASK